jgi:hypothetical protein
LLSYYDQYVVKSSRLEERLEKEEKEGKEK